MADELLASEARLRSLLKQMSGHFRNAGTAGGEESTVIRPSVSPQHSSLTAGPAVAGVTGLCVNLKQEPEWKHATPTVACLALSSPAPLRFQCHFIREGWRGPDGKSFFSPGPLGVKSLTEWHSSWEASSG
jgi:hypothetical protein